MLERIDQLARDRAHKDALVTEQPVAPAPTADPVTPDHDTPPAP